jgi:hypothetical protein
MNRSVAMSQRIQCPNPVCPQPDDVQKASLVSQERTALNLVGAAWQLQPPDRPADGNWGCWAVGGVIFFGLFAVLMAYIFVVTAFELNGVQYGDFEYWGNLALAGGLFVVSVGSIYLTFSYHRAAASEIPAWERKLAKWDQLYYCNRCGSVFNPSEGDKFVPASHMKELLV